jgi:AhpC/TSA family
MRSKMLALSILALAPAILMAWPQVGEVAPDFTLPDTAYVNHSLSDYRGSVLMLNFWQST